MDAIASTADYSSGVVYERVASSYDVHSDGTYTKTWETSRLIETEQGATKEASFTIPFKAGFEEVNVLDARVITADGRELKVAPDAVFTQEPKAAPETATFSDIKLKTVVFPEVRPGSRLLLKYELKRLKPDFAGVFSEIEWYSIHAKRLEYSYRFKAPRSMKLHVDATDMTLTHRDMGDDEEWIATGTVLTPVAQEPGGPAGIAYSPRLSVSSLPDYKAFAAMFSRLTADSAAVSPPVAALAEQLTSGISGVREQARALYEWVSHNIRYVGIQIGAGSWISRPAADVLVHRYGDCKDHVALLEALLRAKGIRSTGALINADLSWWLPATATPQAFNHIITYVPSLDLFLDSTARYVDFGVLPGNDADKKVLLVDRGELMTTPRTRAEDNANVVEQALHVSDDGVLSGTSKVRASGESAAIVRAFYFNLQSMPDEQIVAAMLQQDNESGSGTLKRPEVAQFGVPVETKLAFTLSDHLVRAEEGTLSLARGVYFGGAKAFGKGVSDAPRHLPYLCPAVSYAERTTLDLPAGARLSTLPAGKHVAGKDAALGVSYDSSYRYEGNSVFITRNFKFDPAHPVCNPASYETLRTVARAIRDDYATQGSIRH